MKKRYPTRGFASMSKEQRSAIAQKGGLSAQASGRGHRFTVEEARAAGKLGGRKRQQAHLDKISGILTKK